MSGPLSQQISEAGPEVGRPMTALLYLLDVLHAHQVTNPTAWPKRYPLGVATERRAVGQKGNKSAATATPPSVAAALKELTVAAGYEASLPFIRFGPPAPDTIVGKAIEGALPNVLPPAAIPLSGARHDCMQLRYNRPGPLCAGGPECIGACLAGAPAALKVYQTPAEAKAGVFPPSPAFCLLCIRTDAAALVKTLTAVVSSSAAAIGGAAMVMPPFQNLVNCPDGYRSECLGVTPTTGFVFAPISIAGPSDKLIVAYDESAMDGFYVDQTPLLWGCTPPEADLNGGALEDQPHQAPTSSASSQ